MRWLTQLTQARLDVHSRETHGGGITIRQHDIHGIIAAAAAVVVVMRATTASSSSTTTTHNFSLLVLLFFDDLLFRHDEI